MTPERWARITNVFRAALEKPAGERAAFVENACGSDVALRRDIERLLASAAQPSLPSPLPEFLEGSNTELAPGDMLAHYRIEAKSGEGGMGAVYRAYDTRLRRKVALKMLPPDALADPDRMGRLMQEARATSALNHPNIVTIYEVGSDRGVDFIAMEWVSGKTLAQLIGRKGLPLRDALKHAVRIASALAAAHRAGILHRDLKPANIMVNDAGLVKVLDFGLAKRTERAAGEEAGSTHTMGPETDTGAVLGTVAYMSPEQAEGKKLDGRSDIFSFGVVLYEMVTSKRAFERDSTAATLAAILKEEPKPAGELAGGLPPDLDKVLTRCLRKDPARRFQHMEDLEVALEEIEQESDSGALEKARPASPRRFRKLLWAAGLALVLAVAMAVVWIVRFSAPVPEAALVPVPLTSYPGTEEFPSFSPDGTQVAFQWCPEGKECKIYVKQIGVEPPSRLTVTAGGEFSPAWSPDGRFVAFLREVAPGKAALIIVPQRGGRERVLADIAGTFWGELPGPYLAWAPDSKWIAFPSGDPVPALFLLSVDTQEQRKLTNPPSRPMGDGDTTPAFSPDGRTLAFARFQDGETRADLYVLRLAAGYAAEREPARLRSTNLLNFAPTWTPDGKEVVFSANTLTAGSGLWRIKVSTKATPRKLAFAPGEASTPAVSQQLNRLAYSEDKYDTNIWRIDLQGPGSRPSAPAQFIASTRPESAPMFSPDGKRIAFVSQRSGASELWVCDNDGSNPAQLTSLAGPPIGALQWSWDSRSIAFWVVKKENEIYVVNANGGLARRLSTPPGGGKFPYWARDGQWLYFNSGKGVWKMRSTGGGAIQVTRNGGDVPQESPDGKFLYYSKGWPLPLSVWKMPVEGGPETKVLDSVNPSTLWTVGSKGIYFFSAADDKGRSGLGVYEFATAKTTKLLAVERNVISGLTVSPDGRRILYTQFDEAGSDLMLVENFR